MFKKDILLKVNENKIDSFEFGKKDKLIKLDIGDHAMDIKALKDFNVRIRNRNLYIMIEGEETYIKYMEFPKVCGEELDKLIQNQLIYLYGGKAEEIFYSYTIFREEENQLEVLVFCVNCQKLNKLQSVENYIGAIKKVNLIQFCFLDYFKRYILERNYFFVFKYNKDLYLIVVANNKIIADKIVRDKSYEILIREYNNLKKKSSSFKVSINKIYSVNFCDLKFKEYVEKEDYLQYTDLGEIDEGVIVQSFVYNRR